MTTKSSNIKLVQMPQKTLAYVRNVGHYMQDTGLFGKLLGKVWNWGGPKGIFNNPGTEAITVYHDDQDKVPEEKQRISVGFTVPSDTKVTGDIQKMEIPAGDYVAGSFEILPDDYPAAWHQVFQYIGEEQLTVGETMYEVYRNEPGKHPEGKHQVDICVQVLK